MTWHEKNSARWQREQELAAATLSEFKAGIDDGKAYFCGGLDLCSEHGHVYDTARIRIVYPLTFPARNQPPSVYLESHRDRWRKGGDSHIESDWKLCLFVPGESRIKFGDDHSVRDLLGVVHTFLLKERIYQRRLVEAEIRGGVAEWPGADRSHGEQGIREAVREMGRVGRNAPCPCGSGLKFKKCHLGKL